MQLRHRTQVYAKDLKIIIEFIQLADYLIRKAFFSLERIWILMEGI